MARLLIVDDEDIMRAAVRLALSGTPWEITEADNGEAALRELQRSAFDAVMLDVRMPGIDGIETLRRLRGFDKTTPVFLVTGYGSDESREEGLKLGATAYIAKPFKNQELLEALATHLPPPPPVTPAKPEVLTPPEAPPLAPALDLPPLERGQPWRWIAVIFALAAVTVLAYRPVRDAWSPPSQDYALPYSNPTGLIWHKDRLWVLDWMTQSIYVHRRERQSLPIVKTYHLPPLHVAGMAMVEGMLFTADPWTHQIRKHRLDEFLSVVATYPSPGPAPTALFWDGKYLWCGDTAENKIYQLQLANKLLVINSFAAPGRALAGFYKDDNFAWSADSQTRRLYQHRLNDRLTVIASYALPDFERGPEPLSSFTWAQGDLWYAKDRIPTLHRRRADLLLKDPPSSNETDTEQRIK